MGPSAIASYASARRARSRTRIGDACAGRCRGAQGRRAAGPRRARDRKRWDRRGRGAQRAGTVLDPADVRIAAGQHADVAFYIAAGPEQDGAHATVSVMRRRGWRDLLTATRDALRDLEQTTGHEALDRLINRNLLLAYFYGVGRALDDAHFYLVRTRTPWHGRGVTFREWESLTWTLPAVQLADSTLARELILRACEVHGYSPGSGVRYLNGTLFEPGFCLEGAASYALAVDRYIRETNDDQIVEEPVLADTLYLASDDIAARRNSNVPLYSTEVAPSGNPGAAAVHVARQRCRRAGARGLSSDARRADRARRAGSGSRARGAQAPLRARPGGQVDVCVRDRSERQRRDGR